jgi:hypothetical protein
MTGVCKAGLRAGIEDADLNPIGKGARGPAHTKITPATGSLERRALNPLSSFAASTFA